MGWFGRKKKADPASAEPDEHLGLLSRADADLLRSLVHRTLAESGAEPQMLGDHARTADGSTLGFDNLARRLRGIDDRDAWPDAVRAHIASVRADPGEQSEEQLRSAIITRLFELDVEGPISFDYAPVWQEGIGEVLTVDYPDRVEFLGQDRAEEMAPLGPWFDRARENLRRTIREADVRVERVQHEERWIDCAVSDCVYLASAATFIAEALPLWSEDVDLSNGVLFAVPFRHQLAFRDCRDGDAVLAGLMLLPRFAVGGYGDGVGPLSPHVYHWHDGEVRQITRLREGAIEVHPGPELEALLNARS